MSVNSIHTELKMNDVMFLEQSSDRERVRYDSCDEKLWARRSHYTSHAGSPSKGRLHSSN